MDQNTSNFKSKTGRPKMSDDDKKTHRLEIRLTKKEMENLTKKSKSKGMSKSAYIISRIDQDKIKIDDFNVFINLGMEISDLNYKLEQLEKSNPNQPKILAEIKKIATLSEEIRLKVFQNTMK